VGRLCVPIFGQADEKGRAVADHLGLALQLTNIIRDVPEDAEIGRLYLPSELLDGEAITSRAPNAVANHSSLPRICETLGLRAEQAYDDAKAAIAQCDPKAMRAPIIMMNVYYLNLKRLRKSNWQPQALLKTGKLRRTGQKLEKLLVALRYSAAP
ncbi:MAG: squalene/phytoene synthase family protein, partial [Litorimonas sp.]